MKKDSDGKRIGFGRLPRRRRIVLTDSELVELAPLTPKGYPLVIRPAIPRADLAEWIEDNIELIESRLAASGAILFRGFPIDGIEVFERLVTAAHGELMDYTYRSTPRTRITGNVFTSTEYPADQSIPLHNEMAYASVWPMRLWFWCVQSAASGGETPLADARRIYSAVDPPLREKFQRNGVLYVRNYGAQLDLPWQQVFGTSDSAAVEARCRAMGIEFEWKPGQRLQTRQLRPATATHPTTSESVWFNQAHLFHVSSVPQRSRDALLGKLGEDELPRNAYFGDGSAIDDRMVTTIRAIYEDEAVTFSWQNGDVLLLDNMLVAHGRRPYDGERRILVAMTRPSTAS